MKLNLDLSEIKKGIKNLSQRSKKKNTLYNIDMLYKSKNNVIKLYDDYISMVSKVKHATIKGT